MGTKEAKDGVTLIADAIRKEREAKAKESALKSPLETNVAEVTAQFKKPSTTKETGVTLEEVTKEVTKQAPTEATEPTVED